MTKGQFRILVVLTVVFGFLGGAVSNMVLRGAPASAAGPATAVQDEVRAKQFVLVDDNGEMRAALSPGIGGEGLWLYDAAGKLRVMLGTDTDGSPGLDLYDAAGKKRSDLSLLADGNSGLDFRDAAGKGQVVLGTSDKSGPLLSLMSGNLGTILGLSDQGSMGLSLIDAAGNERASLRIHSDGSPSLSLVDAAGRPRAGLGLTADGIPALALLKGNGDVLWQAP